jgi:hypothetical protein
MINLLAKLAKYIWIDTNPLINDYLLLLNDKNKVPNNIKRALFSNIHSLLRVCIVNIVSCVIIPQQLLITTNKIITYFCLD